MDIFDDEEEWSTGENLTSREWSKMSEVYSNAGYREGMTEGKEAALQPGFDEGFARVGEPIGRRLGSLRGLAAGLISILSSEHADTGRDANERSLKNDAVEISQELNDLRFSDLVTSSNVELPENNLEELKKSPSPSTLDATSSNADASFEKLEKLEERLKRLCLELKFAFRL